jgi:hypothetical protein
MINPWRETSKTRLPIFQILSRITNQTNAEARLFELLVAVLCETEVTYVSAVGYRSYSYFFLA